METAHPDEPISGRDYDVMVIGGGGAGSMAAIHAAAKQAHVCLLEATAKLGGSTALSGGRLMAADTRIQRENNVVDSTAAFFADVLAVNPDSVDPEALRRVCEGSRDVLEWLTTRGVSFSYDPAPPRCHGADGFGEGLYRGIETALSQAGVDIALRSRVTRLLTDNAGAVTGAIVDGEPVSAGAVILATGGYGANREMLHQFLPRSDYAGDWLYYVGNPANVGDGIEMGKTLGAAVVGPDQGLVGTGNGFHKTAEVHIPGWLMVVNEQGKRFASEFSPYWVFPERLREQTNHRGFAIMDSRMIEEAYPDRRLAIAYALGFTAISWLPDDLKENVVSGKVVQAGSVAELARRIKIDPATLEATVARYNGFCASGNDEEFGKTAEDLESIKVAPFFAIEVRNHIVWVTQGGLVIDKDARVLKAKGGPAIPGLYAAGEVTGNVLGARYAGTGFSIANALTFGRIAGERAA
ncbi:MAG: FAD-binding protein, partial [Deltaproteobacteria bacterium]|nr:FAD-binding protein [Deltaproteobacteria bacterium]